MNEVNSVPFDGAGAFEHLRRLEAECETQTLESISQLGEKIPRSWPLLGTGLADLDMLSSCFWGCSGGDHVVEYLCGRASNEARAAVRLLCMGFYDESLVMTRAIGEIGNLLQLVLFDPDQLARWKALDRGERIAQYGPAGIRRALERLGVQPIISEDRYRRLCEIAAHVTPATLPQGHNVLGIPTAAGFYQEAGVILCMNELILAAASALVFGAGASNLQRERKSTLMDHGISLSKCLGKADVMGIDDCFAALRNQPGAKDEIAAAAGALRLQQLRRRHERSKPEID